MNAICCSVRKPGLSVCLFLSLIASGAFGQATPQVTSPVDNAQRVTLSGNVHPLARAEFDRGTADSGMPMERILLLLKRSDAQEAALQTYMEQQQDKSSPNYQVWLTPAQLGAQYGPADSDVQAVTQWLGSRGFTVNKVYSGKTVIEFSGTVAQVQAAFGTAIHNFQVNGKMYVANANDPQIPAALAPVVSGIVSLNNFPRQSNVRVAGQARKIAGQPGLKPTFTFPVSGQSTDFYGVGPADFATIYNAQSLINSGNNGSGQTIAVVGETDINVADVQAFRQMFGLSANFTTSNVILNGEDPGITSQDEETEADLDVQWSGAVAPGATIDYVVSESTPASQGIDLSALYIIEYNLAGVMSESYSNCESFLGAAGNAFYKSMWEQAAAQGITVVLSAGDGGSAGCDDFSTASTAQYGLAVSGLASTPFNVAVGGTDFDDVNKWSTYWSASNNSTTGESALSYVPEIPWNQNCAQISLTGCTTNPPSGSLNIVAGSGGASNTYSKPSWQLGVTGMPNDSHRDLPDVSLFASPGFDNSGYVICAGDGTTITGPSQCNATPGVYNITIVGGTSASTPAFSGVMALVNQKESTTQNPAPRQGNANHVLYALAKKSGASCTSAANEAAGCIFNDITHGNSSLPTGAAGVGTNSVPCQGGTPNCSETVSSENGVLVEPTNSQIEAYTVNAGYDLVTGLGSVNIGNLATNWSTVNTMATTTTLTLSPTTGITHGTAENVTVNVTVTPASGTATGDVSLIATIAGPSGATTQGLDQFTLNSSGKVVNATTNSLPGGTSYQVYAHYAGDGTNAPSDSAPVTVTVAKETSQTFIVIPTYTPSGSLSNGNATGVTYGTDYALTMYVTDKNGVASLTGPPVPTCYEENALVCPSGTVSFTDNGKPFGTGAGGTGIYKLNSGGYSQSLTPTLTGGTHTLVASYSGDNSYNSSAGTATFTVTPGSTSFAQSFTVTKATTGAPFYDNVTGSSQAMVGAAPTGTITFYDGTTPIGSPTSIQGSPGGSQPAFFATGSLTLTTGGSHTINAQYSGDTNYAPSTNSASIYVLYATTASLTANPSTVNYGASITLTAIIGTGVPASNTSLKPTGTVTLTGGFDNPTVTSVVAQADNTGNWELLVSATATPNATETYTLIYPGDNNYAHATVTSNQVTVNIPDFSLAPAGGVTVVPVSGQSASTQVTVTPLSQTPSTVNLGFEAYVTSIVGYTLTIDPQQVILNGSAVVATVSLSPSRTASTPSNIRRSNKRRASFLYLDLDQINWWWLSFAGVASLLLLSVSKRHKRYRVVMGVVSVSLVLLALGCGGGSGASGGGTGGGGTGGGGGGTPQATTITLTTSNAKVSQTGTFTLTATVTGKSPTGQVQFYVYGSAYGLPVILTNGQAQMGEINNLIGLYEFTASYSGDANNQPSTTTSTVAQTVTGTMQFNVQGATGGDIHIIPITIGLQ